MSHVFTAVQLFVENSGLGQVLVVGLIFALLFIAPVVVKKVINKVRGFFGALNQVEGVVVDPATGELIWL